MQFDEEGGDEGGTGVGTRPWPWTVGRAFGKGMPWEGMQEGMVFASERTGGNDGREGGQGQRQWTIMGKREGRGGGTTGCNAGDQALNEVRHHTASSGCVPMVVRRCILAQREARKTAIPNRELGTVARRRMRPIPSIASG